jgi:hypothetical protein
MEVDELNAIFTNSSMLAHVRSKQPLFTDGFATQLSSLCSWDMIEEMLTLQRIQPQRVQMHRDGVRIPQPAYLRAEKATGDVQIRSADVVFLLTQGASLRLLHTEHSDYRIAAIAAALEKAYQAVAHVDICVRTTRLPKPGIECDYSDCIIAQVDGAEAWLLYQPQIAFPVSGWDDFPPQDHVPPHWRGVLEPGSVLYVPRGWRYRSSLYSGKSLQLRLSVCPPTGTSFLTWLSMRVNEYECFRRDIPHYGTTTDRKAYMDELRRTLDGLFQLCMLDRFMSQESERTLPTTPVSLHGMAHCDSIYNG